jgi:hypothetical protein
MKVAATTIARNAADILPLVLHHHFAEGVDAFHVIDDCSTDETPYLLERLSSAGVPVVWQRREVTPGQPELPFDERQLAMADELASQAAGAGASWIVTTDADEFWHVPGGLVRFLDSRTEVDAVSFELVNFVQWRHAPTGDLASLRTMVARPSTPIRKGAYNRLDPASAPPWIVRRPTRKTIARAGVRLSRGAHSALDPEATVETSAEGACLHAPIRSRASLEVKRRFKAAGGEAELDAIWRDNSWVVPFRVGSAPRSARLSLDLRLARVELRYRVDVRRPRWAAFRPRSRT